jgi:hypothetical protein
LQEGKNRQRQEVYATTRKNASDTEHETRKSPRSFSPARIEQDIRTPEERIAPIR